MIVNLLMRFYDIDSGKIMISNQDFGEIASGTLRKNCGNCVAGYSFVFRYRTQQFEIRKCTSDTR